MIARSIILFSALTIASCSDHPAAHRTEGWREGDRWTEVERRAVGDAIYTRWERGDEYRWFVTQNLRTRPMRADEQVPE
jgi:hypothetical protein